MRCSGTRCTIAPGHVQSIPAFGRTDVPRALCADSSNTMAEKDFEAMAKEAAEYIKKLAPGFTPKIALTLGSGCGDVANEIVPVCQVEYGKLPGFPVSSVQGHAGVLILGHLAGVPIVGLKGRVHYYEGNPRSMVVPVYTMKLLGAEHIFITNASGSLREEMGPGALVALTDHMNFSGVNPLVGPNCDGMGPRFPSLYQAYDPAKLSDDARRASERECLCV